MSFKPKHPRFESSQGVPLDHLIDGFGRWNHVSVVQSSGMGPKCLALVRFHTIKKKGTLFLNEIKQKAI